MFYSVRRRELVLEFSGSWGKCPDLDDEGRGRHWIKDEPHLLSGPAESPLTPVREHSKF